MSFNINSKIAYNIMKRIYNYILLSALTFMTVSCIEESLEPDMPSFGSGNDVKFGLSLEDPKTRTIYGPEDTTFTEDKKIDKISFPIYWSEGDVVLVGSPQCPSGRNSAEYEVTPKEGQSYAEALTAKGAYGVQWGSSETADFYSVYPSVGTSWTSLTEKSNVTAKLNIASEQSANIVLDGATYNAADMGNVIMYAQTNGVKNGETANLKYKPYSTILEFELKIAENTDEQGNSKGFGSIKVLSLTLTAPTGIALTGDFSLQFNGSDVPTITAAGNNGNSIKMDFATQPLLDKTNQTLKAKLAMIPISGIEKLENWTIAVDVLNGTDTEVTTHTKTMNIESALVPGKIHKIKLPQFKSETAWNPSLNNWIPTLYDYKNIYITELSLPGAWYAGASTDEGYQSTDNIKTLWDAGVRAYAVECRSSTSSLFSSTPSRVVISGTGNNSTGLSGAKWYYGGTRISTIISSIATQVGNSTTKDSNGNIIDGEFAVLVLSYADGGEGGRRSQDFEYFINGIKTEIENAGVSNIYSGPVTANTTVDQVLGKLIIKINVDDNLTKGSYTNDMNTLFSYSPFLQQLSDVDFEEPLFTNLYWKTWENSYLKQFATSNSDGFLWCFASANRTQVNPEEGATADATIPTYAQRQTALRGMIEHSKELTATKKHNVWFYFNAGGTQTTSQSDDNTSGTAFATTMNKWLYDLVKLKANGGTDTNGVYGTAGAYVESEPSPLGIVMFNFCTNDTYYGPEIIKEIVYMNNKADLLRATNSGGGDEGNMDEE